MKTTSLTLIAVFGALVAFSGFALAASDNGAAGDMPALYDGELFTINFKKMPPGGTDANIQHNGSINTIYMSDPGLPGGEPFISVLDAIQGDGFNPLWEEVQIAFNPGHTPPQLNSPTHLPSPPPPHYV